MKWFSFLKLLESLHPGTLTHVISKVITLIFLHGPSLQVSGSLKTLFTLKYLTDQDTLK